VLAYDGTGYAGWQVQPDAVTVQGLVSAAARTLLGLDSRIVGASRTDAGVHALGQVASLTTGAALEPAGILGALNAELPPDIRVLAVTEAHQGFDARHAAVGKRYTYLVDNAPIADPLLRRYAWHVRRPLDVEAMRRALAHLRGRHDFSAFCAAPGRGTSPVCVVRAAHLVCRKRRLGILLSADRFLHHMMRNVVGSLVAVGRGTRPAEWVADVLASRDRTRAGPTAPPHGLTLLRVLYERVGC